jgi:hypothetical protein
VRTLEAPALPAGEGAAAIDRAREQIVASNLFSASRRAPRKRFVAPGTMSSSMPESMPGPDAASGADVEAGPQLFGILSIDGRPRALLQIAAELLSFSLPQPLPLPFDAPLQHLLTFC